MLKQLALVALPELADVVFEHCVFTFLHAHMINRDGIWFPVCMAIPKAYCSAVVTPLVLSSESLELVLTWEVLEMCLEIRRAAILISGQTRMQNSWRMLCRVRNLISTKCHLHTSSRIAPREESSPTICGRAFSDIKPCQKTASTLAPASVVTAQEAEHEGDEEAGMAAQLKRCCSFLTGLCFIPRQETTAIMAPFLVLCNHVEISAHAIVLMMQCFLDGQAESTISFDNLLMLLCIRCSFELLSDVAVAILAHEAAGGQQEQDHGRPDVMVAAAASAMTLTFMLFHHSLFYWNSCPMRRSENQQLVMQPLVTFGPCVAS